MSDVQSQRAILGRMSLLALATAVVGWFAVAKFDWLLPIPILLTAMGLFFGFRWLVQPRAPRTGTAPDVLAENVGPYFHRDDLCFASRLSVKDGICWFHLFCQNNDSIWCAGTVYFLPMEGGRADGPAEVEPIVADIELDGGEVAVVSWPYPISARWQGKLMVYDVMAKVAHPQGRGRILRLARGAAVGEPTSEAAEALKMAGGLMFGHLKISHGASCELRLPQGVAEAVPGERKAQFETLWKPPM